MIARPVTLALILIGIAALGSIIWALAPKAYWGPPADAIIGVTAFAISAMTFFGVAALNTTGRRHTPLTGERLRTAIACSLILTYLFVLCFTTFVKNSADVGVITTEFIRSFSTVINITIAFYFGSSALTQILAPKKAEKENKSDVKPPAPPTVPSGPPL